MKTLKLRNKEEVSEAALLEDMKAFLSSYRETHQAEERQDLPLYKQIKADVEERPLTVRGKVCRYFADGDRSCGIRTAVDFQRSFFCSEDGRREVA